MSLASSRLAHTHEAVIDRLAAGIDGGDGWDTATWTDEFATHSCSVWPVPPMESVRTERTIQISGYVLSFPPGTDITQKDRVAYVATKGGDTYLDGPLQITTVQKFSDHLEVTIERPD